MPESANVVLAVDPGRSKCGIAVVGRPRKVVWREVANSDELESRLRDLAGRFSPDIIILGNGTSSSDAVKTAESVGCCAVVVVEEQFTSLIARKRYFQEHPPRGLRKLIPTSLQTPPCPYDDYVAVILAERYFDGMGKA